MSTPAEQKRTISAVFEHDSAVITATNSLTFNMSKGTDTPTNRYLNLEGGIAYGINVMPNAACSVTIINGRTLKSPMSIGVLGWVEGKCRIWNFTIQASSTTTVEVEVKE